MKRKAKVCGDFSHEEMERLLGVFDLVENGAECMIAKDTGPLDLAFYYNQAFIESYTLVIFTENFRIAFIESLFPGAIVVSGERYVSDKERNSKSPEFTKREELFLKELGYGLSTKELCQKMVMSERSVRRMKEKLLEKTGLFSSQQLGLYSLLSTFLRTLRS